MSLENALLFIVTRRAQFGACKWCLARDGQQWNVATVEEIMQLKDTGDHPHGHCEFDVEIDVDLERLMID